MRKLVKQIWNTKGLARWIFLVGLIITILFVVAAIFAPWIAPFDFNQTRDAAGVKFPKLAPPGGDHWLGTNDQFYDIWSNDASEHKKNPMPLTVRIAFVCFVVCVALCVCRAALIFLIH